MNDDWRGLGFGIYWLRARVVRRSYSSRAWSSDISTVEEVRRLYEVDELDVYEFEAALDLVVLYGWRGPLATLKQRVHERLTGGLGVGAEFPLIQFDDESFWTQGGRG